MSGRVGDLSEKQSAVLNQFKENVKDVTSSKHDDHYLLRWLRARNFDLKKSEKMLRDSLEWREQVGADTILEEWVPPEVLQKFWPGGLHGHDKEGVPIWIEPFGYADVKGLLHSCKKSDIIKLKVFHNEQIQKEFDMQTKKLGRYVDGLIIIADFDKYGLRHMWKPAIDLFKFILSMFEANYPETSRRTYVINTPRLFPVLFNMGKPFLSEDTKTKIHILGSNWKERLLKDIDADQLPVHWGGTAVGEGGDPFCTHKVCMGGDVPESYYIPKEDFVMKDSFTTVQIGRSASLQLEYTVQQPNSLIQWQFSTEGKDIGFAVYQKTSEKKQKLSDMTTIVPAQRCNSHMVPEDGFVTCKVPGIYVMKFDNTYSWMNTKTLSYHIQVLDPDNLDTIQKSLSFAVTNGI